MDRYIGHKHFKLTILLISVHVWLACLLNSVRRLRQRPSILLQSNQISKPTTFSAFPPTVLGNDLFEELFICNWVSLCLQGDKRWMCVLSMCVEVVLSSRSGRYAWLEAGTLRTRPVKLDCVHDDHDQGHDEGDGVEVEWG